MEWYLGSREGTLGNPGKKAEKLKDFLCKSSNLEFKRSKQADRLETIQSQEIDQKLINPEMTEINPTPDNILLDEVEREEEEDRKIFNISCDTIRKKINMFLGSKVMTQTQFLKEIGGVNSNSFGRFMKLKGSYSGSDNGTFHGACRFFAARDKAEKAKRAEEKKKEKEAAKEAAKAEKKMAIESKKRKLSDTEEESDEDEEEQQRKARKINEPTATLAASSTPAKGKKANIDQFLADVNAVQVEDQNVYDDCDVVREKISSFLATENIPMSRFAKALDITPRPISKFLSVKGFDQGAGSDAYRKAYFFFEKLRIYRKEEKSKKRIQAEKEHPNGYRLGNPITHVWVHNSMPAEAFNAMIKRLQDPHRDQFAPLNFQFNKNE